MKNLSRVLWTAFAVFVAGFAASFGANANELLSLPADGLMLIGMAATMPAAPAVLPWRRIRDVPLNFLNVSAGRTAIAEIPRYARTLHRIVMELTGTTFPVTHVTEWRLKLGSKTISKGTGAHLSLINAYSNAAFNGPAGYGFTDARFLVLDFTNKRDKILAGELIGGLDLTKLPAGLITLEVDVSASASAPSLQGLTVWGPPQPNSKIKRLLQFTGAFSVTGRQVIPLDLGKGDLQRLFTIYAGSDWCGTAATLSAWSGNTGNGTPGAVTVAAATKIGTHKFAIVEPGANVGTFLHQDPDGILVSSRGVVASSYTGGGLTHTLADGATDFVSGDGFDCVVGLNTNGNVSRVEIKKDGLPLYDRTCLQARYEQKEYGAVPQSKCFVADLVVERNPEGLLRTADATALEFAFTATATDTFTMYAEVLQDVEQLK